jgi:hypothetical protein
MLVAVGFTLSFGLKLILPPPRTVASMVADVAGDTLANDACWGAKCKVIPEDALYVTMVVMKHL